MATIITGSGLGLFNTSANLIGTAGDPLVGRSGQSDAVYVNGMTGNVVIRAQDEFVTSLGLDTSLIRTYNSQGIVDGDNNDNWRIGVYRRLTALTGTLNTLGSTITKTFGDGAEVIYTYNGSA
jgi:hypothetical protein